MTFKTGDLLVYAHFELSGLLFLFSVRFRTDLKHFLLFRKKDVYLKVHSDVFRARIFQYFGTPPSENSYPQPVYFYDEHGSIKFLPELSSFTLIV
jgi:hypothetical protein